jgi:hypothetical protein
MKVVTLFFAASSFIFGYLVMNVIVVELKLLEGLRSPDTNLMGYIKPLLLILSHIGIISLCFFRKRSWVYEVVLRIAPLVFIICFFSVGGYGIGVYPLLLTSFIPFITLWIVLLVSKRKANSK